MAKVTLIGVFGLPCVGKGAVISAIQHQMQRTSATVSSSGEVADLLTPEIKAQMKGGALFPLEDQLRERIRAKTDFWIKAGRSVIFLDGFPRFNDQVDWLVNVYHPMIDANVMFLKVDGGSLENIKKRAETRARDEFDTDPVLLMARIDRQASMITGIEQAIFRHGLPYYTVVNSTSPVDAASQFMRQVPPPND